MPSIRHSFSVSLSFSIYYSYRFPFLRKHVPATPDRRFLRNPPGLRKLIAGLLSRRLSCRGKVRSRFISKQENLKINRRTHPLFLQQCRPGFSLWGSIVLFFTPLYSVASLDHPYSWLHSFRFFDLFRADRNYPAC